MTFSCSNCPESPIKVVTSLDWKSTLRGQLFTQSKEIVLIYRNSTFELFNADTGKSTFNFNSFWNMVMAIGHVLQGAGQAEE